MGSDRMRRVDEGVRQVLADVLAGGLKDPRVGFVTVTDVRTAPDLSHARVSVSVLGDELVRTESLAGLQSAHSYLQGCIATELKLRRTPTLEFVYDGTTDRAQRVEQLLGESSEQ